MKTGVKKLIALAALITAALIVFFAVRTPLGDYELPFEAADVDYIIIFRPWHESKRYVSDEEDIKQVVSSINRAKTGGSYASPDGSSAYTLEFYLDGGEVWCMHYFQETPFSIGSCNDSAGRMVKLSKLNLEKLLNDLACRKTIDAPPEGVGIEVVESTLTPTSLELHYVNTSTDKEYGYGEAFHIDKFVRGKWRCLETTDTEIPRSFPSVGYTLGAAGSIAPNGITKLDDQTKRYVWENYYADLDKGDYRIAIDINENCLYPENYTLSAEFEIP
ncbi:MAG: hypothetical protein IJP23_05855 [Oscillospiraceae bacterium]|nr:hypothetical protein [Oscillospiraceae bacterium]